MTTVYNVNFEFLEIKSSLLYERDSIIIGSYLFSDSVITITSRSPIVLDKEESIQSMSALLKWDKQLLLNYPNNLGNYGYTLFNSEIEKNDKGSPENIRLKGKFKIDNSTLCDVTFNSDTGLATYKAQDEIILSYASGWKLLVSFYQNYLNELLKI